CRRSKPQQPLGDMHWLRTGLGFEARMALFKAYGSDVALGASGYDAHKLSSPRVFLLSMLIFLAIAAFVAAVLYPQISKAFFSNPPLKGWSVGVVCFASLLPFGQVIRLSREGRWANPSRAGAETTEPVLLAPMKQLLSRSSATSLSTGSMPPMLDSIANRLD